MSGSLTIENGCIFSLRHDMWEDIKEYKEDFMKIIKARESRCVPFLHHSPQLHLRKRVVEYLKEFSASKNMSHCCLHLAVYLVDIFMDNHSIVPEKMLLVANVCLLLAAKFDEVNNRTPKLKELNEAVGNAYSLTDYTTFELKILSFFDFNLMFPTAAHYIHYFIQAAICSEDLKHAESPKALCVRLLITIRMFLEKILEDIHYMQDFVPSKLAAAVIAASRIQVGITSWNEYLEHMTQYKRRDIQEPLEALIKFDYFKCPTCLTKV